MNNKVRVRFAPSPTGYLHVGGLRTALYNYLFAKQQGGDFLLRIEDTDRSRFVEGAVEKLLESMRHVGLQWDEGLYVEKSQIQSSSIKESEAYPNVFEGGEHGPYAQSERLDLYKKYTQELINEGKAYYCFCAPERLEKMRKQQIAEKKPPKYDRCCVELDANTVKQKLASGEPFVVRFKVPENETIKFKDLVRDEVSFQANLIDDQILLKSDGYPTYHLANVVDDHLMGITHVIRGEEWLPSTPKHVLLYNAFGWNVPEFAHLPLLLNPDKSKLSKRQGDVAVEDYIAKGYLKEALINFVALLGWNPGEGSTQEIFTLEELIEKFDIQKVHKAGAVFDLQKLDWINSQHIKKLPVQELYELTKPFLQFKEAYFSAPSNLQTPEYMQKVLAIEQQRLAKLSDVTDEHPYFFKTPQYEKSMLKWKEMTEVELKQSLQTSLQTLSQITDESWMLENIEKALLDAAGEKRGDLLWPLRVALTGAQKSPSPFEVAWVIGREESIKRINTAIEKL